LTENSAVSVIGISGPSGSGKTTIAGRLCRTLGEAALLSLDAYYSTDADVPQTANFCDLKFLHVADFQRDARALADGRSVEIDDLDPVTFAPTGRRIRIEPQPWLVLEGMVLFRIPRILDLCDFRVYLAPDMNALRSRKLERDAVERARSVESTLAQLKWVETEFAHDLSTLDGRVTIIDATRGPDEVFFSVWSHLAPYGPDT
jgi:uridine kinase